MNPKLNDEPNEDEVLATIRVEGVTSDHETGTLDIPLNEARKIADWVRRYDLRPTKKPQAGRGRA